MVARGDSTDRTMKIHMRNISGCMAAILLTVTLSMSVLSAGATGDACPSTDGVSAEHPLFSAEGDMAATYTIVFSPNGGEGDEYTQVMASNVSECLSSNRFTFDGREFAGWSMSESGPVHYADGEQVRDLATSGTVVTLYAVWEPVGYTLFLDTTSGGSGVISISLREDEVFTLPGCFPEFTDMSFKGWSVEKGSSEVVYHTGDRVVNLSEGASSVTLYAVWAYGPPTPYPFLFVFVVCLFGVGVSVLLYHRFHLA